MAANNDTVSTQTMAIAVVVALVVGFLAGVVFSSIQGGKAPAGSPAGQAAAPQGGGQFGQAPAAMAPQLASLIVSLEQRLAVNPNDAEAWVQLGNSYFDSNEFQKAINAYTRFLALKPDNANVLTDLGIMYRNVAQPEEAIKAFDRAMAADPRHVQAPFNKGIVLLNDLHDPQGAIAVWQKLADANPGVSVGGGMPLTQMIEDAKKRLAGGTP